MKVQVRGLCLCKCGLNPCRTLMLSIKNKTELHVDAVLGYLTVIDDDFLILNPGTLNASDGFTGAFYAFFDGIFKTFTGTGSYFSYFCDGHKLAPQLKELDL